MLIIGNLDDDGYFKIEGFDGDPLIRVAQEANVSIVCAEKVLKRIQQFDPVGVAARDLQECLLIQARLLSGEEGIVGAIIKRHLKLLESKNLPAIAKELHVSLEEVIVAVKNYCSYGAQAWSLFFWGRPAIHHARCLCVQGRRQVYDCAERRWFEQTADSATYRNALRGAATGGQAKDFIQDKLRSAVWLIRSIHQRQRTIYKVTESIVKFQKDFSTKAYQI